jgi:hypothetical protein
MWRRIGAGALAGGLRVRGFLDRESTALCRETVDDAVVTADKAPVLGGQDAQGRGSSFGEFDGQINWGEWLLGRPQGQVRRRGRSVTHAGWAKISGAAALVGRLDGALY